MEENSVLFERLMEIIRHYKIKNVSAFAKDYLGYESPEKINRLKKEGRHPSFDIILDIANRFESVDINWLITGRGNMLKDGSKNGNNVVLDQLEKYVAISYEEIDFLRDHVRNLQQENSDLIYIIKNQIKAAKDDGEE